MKKRGKEKGRNMNRFGRRIVGEKNGKLKKYERRRKRKGKRGRR